MNWQLNWKRVMIVAMLAAGGQAAAQTPESRQDMAAALAQIEARMQAMERELESIRAERAQLQSEISVLRESTDSTPPAQLAAVASPASDEPPLAELFGVLDIFLSAGDYGAGTVTRLDSSGAYGTRFGLRGGKRIQPGLELEYHLEAGFHLDSGTFADPSRIFNRQSYVGLKTDYGTFRAGRMNALGFTLVGNVDAMDGGTQSSPMLNLAWYGVRYSNMLGYISPRLANMLTLHAQYGLGEASDGSAKDSNWHLAADVAKGPFGFSLVREREKDATGLVATQNTLAGGSYDFGRLRLYAGYHLSKKSDGSRDAETWSVSGRWQFTPKNWLSLGYGDLTDRTGAGNHANQVGMLYQHFFNADTAVYFGLTKLQNHNQARFTLDGSAVAGEPVAFPGADPQAVQLGLRYWF